MKNYLKVFGIVIFFVSISLVSFASMDEGKAPYNADCFTDEGEIYSGMTICVMTGSGCVGNACPRP